MKDREVVKAVMKAGEPKEVYEILSGHGLDCEYEVFLKTVEEMKQTYEKQQAGLLTEEDMDQLLDSGNNSEMVGTIFFLLISFGA